MKGYNPSMPNFRSLAWKAVLVAACIAVAGAAVAIHWLMRTRADQAARLAQLESDNGQLKARTTTLEREAAALRRGLAVPQGEPHSEWEREPKPAPGTTLEHAKMLIQFREQLAAANRSVEALQVRVQELQFSLEKTTEENKRLAASEADLKEKVAVTSRVLEAVQTELKGKTMRLAELDAANRRLTDEGRTGSDKLNQLTRGLQDLEQINRRRETYLTNILRRFRDITDQYRAVAARLDRDTGTAGASELGGIQNTISMTEEDLRQLAALNAQAVRAQQRISGK